MRGLIAIASLAALTACAPEVPNSAEGVGFQDYDQYRQSREAQLSGRQTAASGQVNVLPPPGGLPSGVPASQEPLPAGSTTASNVAVPFPSGGAAGQTETSATPAPVETAAADAAPETPPNNPGISDEQDFQAVSSRETIQSDRERLEQQREQYQVIEPTALPSRTGGTGPNIVEYALSSTNKVGQSIYRRSGLRSESSFLKNCSRYGSSDQAQAAFLAAGGPERDRNNLDPDGDGFACFWDPTPFRSAVRQ